MSIWCVIMGQELSQIPCFYAICSMVSLSMENAVGKHIQEQFLFSQWIGSFTYNIQQCCLWFSIMFFSSKTSKYYKNCQQYYIMVAQLEIKDSMMHELQGSY